jgi:hypothetical protein
MTGTDLTEHRLLVLKTHLGASPAHCPPGERNGVTTVHQRDMDEHKGHRRCGTLRDIPAKLQVVGQEEVGEAAQAAFHLADDPSEIGVSPTRGFRPSMNSVM